MTQEYYQKHKERLQKEARERYQNLSEEEKEKRRRKAQERHQNLTEEENKKGEIRTFLRKKSNAS